MTKLESLINDEADEAYKWAIKFLKAKDPALSYEYGVRAGFKAGAMAMIEMLRTKGVNDPNVLFPMISSQWLEYECAKEVE